MGAEHDPILSIDEVAKYLRLSRTTVYRMAATGDLPGHKLGKHWRFRQSAIDAWLDARAKPPFGLAARGLEQPVFVPARQSGGLTAEQVALLKGVWIDRPEQFVAIAAKPAGRVSLAKLLGIATEDVQAIARLLDASPGEWGREGSGER